jgi:hypothetical protein
MLLRLLLMNSGIDRLNLQKLNSLASQLPANCYDYIIVITILSKDG